MNVYIFFNNNKTIKFYIITCTSKFTRILKLNKCLASKYNYKNNFNIIKLF